MLSFLFFLERRDAQRLLAAEEHAQSKIRGERHCRTQIQEQEETIQSLRNELQARLEAQIQRRGSSLPQFPAMRLIAVLLSLAAARTGPVQPLPHKHC